MSIFIDVLKKPSFDLIFEEFFLFFSVFYFIDFHLISVISFLMLTLGFICIYFSTFLEVGAEVIDSRPFLLSMTVMWWYKYGPQDCFNGIP